MLSLRSGRRFYLLGENEKVERRINLGGARLNDFCSAATEGVG